MATRKKKAGPTGQWKCTLVFDAADLEAIESAAKHGPSWHVVAQGILRLIVKTAEPVTMGDVVSWKMSADYERDVAAAKKRARGGR